MEESREIRNKSAARGARGLIEWSVYREALRRLAAPGALAGALLAVSHILIAIYVDRDGKRSYTLESLQSHIAFEMLGLPMVLVFLLAAPLFLLYLMRYQTRRDGSDLYHMFPIRRERLAASLLLADWTACAALLMGGAALTELCGAVLPHITLYGQNRWLLTTVNYMAASVFTSAVMLLALSLTGTVFSALSVFTMGMIVPRTVLTTWCYAVLSRSATIPTSLAGTLLDDRLNVAENVVTGFILHGGYDAVRSVRSLIFTLLAGLIYIGLALWLHTRRPSETAGESAVSRRWQSVFRLMPACLMSLVAVLTLLEALRDYRHGIRYDEVALSIAAFFLMAIGIYFLYELITSRRLSECLRAIPGLLWMLLFDALSAAIIYYGGEAIRRDAPRPEQVREVRMTLSRGQNYAYAPEIDWYYHQMEEYAITDPEVIGLLCEALEGYQESIEWDARTNGGEAYQTYARYERASRGENGRGLVLRFQGGTLFRERELWVPKAMYDELLGLLGRDDAYRAIFTKVIPREECLRVDGVISGVSAAEGMEDLLYEQYGTLMEEIAELDFPQIVDHQTGLDFSNYPKISVATRDGRVQQIRMGEDTPESYLSYIAAQGSAEVLTDALADYELPALSESLAYGEGAVLPNEPTHIFLSVQFYNVVPGVPGGVAAEPEPEVNGVGHRTWQMSGMLYPQEYGGVARSYEDSFVMPVSGGLVVPYSSGSPMANAVRDLEEHLRLQKDTAVTDLSAPYLRIDYDVYQIDHAVDSWEKIPLIRTVGYCALDERTLRWLAGIGE